MEALGKSHVMSSDIGSCFQGKNEKGNRDEENAHSLKLLPFEFVALEACLEAACSSLDDEVWISCAAFSLVQLFL